MLQVVPLAPSKTVAENPFGIAAITISALGAAQQRKYQNNQRTNQRNNNNEPPPSRAIDIMKPSHSNGYRWDNGQSNP